MWKLTVAGAVVSVVLLAWAAWCWDKSHDYQADHDQYSALLDRMVFDGYEPERGLFVGASSRDVYEATTKAENQASTYRFWAVLLVVPGVASGVGSVLLGSRGASISPRRGATRDQHPPSSSRQDRPQLRPVERGSGNVRDDSTGWLHNAPLLGRVGAVLIVLGLILPWWDLFERTLGISELWKILSDRASYSFFPLAPGALAAFTGAGAAVVVGWRGGPWWLAAVAGVGSAVMPLFVILHKLWTAGFTFAELGPGVPVELLGVALLACAAVRGRRQSAAAPPSVGNS